MSEKSPGNLLVKFNVIFILFLVVGLSISALVYHFGNNIERSTSQLIDEDLQVYSNFQQLRKQLTEQESALHAYYASFNPSLFEYDFIAAHGGAQDTLDQLAHYFDHTALSALMNNQQIVMEIATALDANMRLQTRSQTDWDLARLQLQQVRQLMQDTHPLIEQLTGIVSQRVEQSKDRVGSQLNYMNVLVFIYGLTALTIALLILRSVKAYLSANKLNSRLALFPQRNPNPIFSFSKNNIVSFANPAALRLAAKLDHSVEALGLKLGQKIDSFQQNIKSEEKAFERFELLLEGLYFQCELHWLSDQRQWDLHLTDVTAKKHAEQKMVFQAYHHPETCLDNQYRFREVLEQFVEQNTVFTHGIIEIRSYSQLLSDNTFNKNHQVVIEIAAVLDKVCHDMPEDIKLFHIGDKNFAILIPTSECSALVKRLVSNIKQQINLAQFSGQHQVELDFGFACFPHDGKDVEEIIRNTRIALDSSASQEHTEYMMFSDQLGAAIARQNALQVAMRLALKNNDFQLYFQPQLDVTKNRVIGAEVLIRWQLDEQWASPAEFIPLAERSGMILPLGDWILKTACEKAAHFVKAGYKDLVVAVNISPKQFTHPNFVENVKNALFSSGLKAKNLELEITEGVLFNNENATINSLHTLKSMGVQLAIDDFGTGFSSLSYLKDFPIDKLKIDQSFVRNMHVDSADQSIVRTIIDLGNNLGVTLIAEGVEELEQLNMLKEMGCKEIQGYWFSKPLDEAYFNDFLASKLSVA